MLATPNNKILVPSHQKKLQYNGENKMLLLNSFSFHSKSNNTSATVIELNLNIPVINHVTLGNKSHKVSKLKYRTLYHNHVKSAENLKSLQNNYSWNDVFGNCII